jgi:hypothetical protein
MKTTAVKRQIFVDPALRVFRTRAQDQDPPAVARVQAERLDTFCILTKALETRLHSQRMLPCPDRQSRAHSSRLQNLPVSQWLPAALAAGSRPFPMAVPVGCGSAERSAPYLSLPLSGWQAKAWRKKKF